MCCVYTLDNKFFANPTLNKQQSLFSSFIKYTILFFILLSLQSVVVIFTTLILYHFFKLLSTLFSFFISLFPLVLPQPYVYIISNLQKNTIGKMHKVKRKYLYILSIDISLFTNYEIGIII